MKNLKLFIIAFALFTISATASIFNPIKPNAELRAEIIDLLGTTCPYDYDKDECKAEVLFTINSNNELIVLSVESPNNRAEAYVKSKMNYEKVSYSSGQESTIYLLPLRMVRE